MEIFGGYPEVELVETGGAVKGVKITCKSSGPFASLGTVQRIGLCAARALLMSRPGANPFFDPSELQKAVLDLSESRTQGLPCGEITVETEIINGIVSGGTVSRVIRMLQ